MQSPDLGPRVGGALAGMACGCSVGTEGRLITLPGVVTCGPTAEGLTCPWTGTQIGQHLRERPGDGCAVLRIGRPTWGVSAPAALPLTPSPRRVSYDPARFPRLLPEAYCLCRGCLTGPRGEEDLRLRSAPVLLPTVVLRRTPGCAGGRAVYAEEYVAVPVGCTCVPAPGSDDADVKERPRDPQRDPARAPGSS